MGRILDDAELVPLAAAARVLRRLGDVCGQALPDALAGAADVYVTTGEAEGLICDLVALCLDAGGMPVMPWAAQPAVCDLWTHSLSQDAVRRGVAGCGRTADERVHVVIDADEWQEVLTAPWGFVVEHLLPTLHALAAVSPDASWMFLNHHGETMKAWRTRFAMVREISRTTHFRRPDGGVFPKLRYDVSFVDGVAWHTGDLRDATKADRMHRVLDAIAGLAGIDIATR